MCTNPRRFVLCALVLALASISTATADLIAHWPLNGDFQDASGNGHDGIPLGSPEFIQDGAKGLVVEFGAADRVMVDDAPELNFSANESLTMTAWALYDPGLAGSGWRAIVGKGRTAPGGDNSYLDTMYAFFVSPDNEWASNMGSLGGNVGPAIPAEWHHFAFVQDGPANSNNYYINMNVVQSGGAANCETPGRPFFIGAAGNDQNGFEGFGGRISDVRLYNEALTGNALVATTLSLAAAELAQDPLPVDAATDVSRDVVLSWAPGDYAPKSNGHRVFLSADIDAVTDGGAVANQSTTSAPEFDVDKLSFPLAFGETYFWRVDEVNSISGWDQGDIWSFTVEPQAIPIVNITATASGANPTMEAVNTINGSGLNELDQHSFLPTDMWLTVTNGSWIQYEFDTAYKLHEMLVWNSNQAIEAFVGMGVKEAVIKTSVDGETWTPLAGVTTFAKASGSTTYTANTTVDLSGIVAKYVKISPQSAHGFTGQSGLSEVRFLYIPVQAREPEPGDGATVQGVDVTLSWRAGREAVSHQINLAADAADLVPVGTTTDARFNATALNYSTTYYWSITEVNETDSPSVYAGPIWNFTTSDYGVVDDYESYSGKEGEEIFMIWLDGFGGDASLGGSTTGHIGAPFVETGLVYSGRQSLPIYIDNDGSFADIDGKTSSPNFSEVRRELSPAQDWTAGGIKTLSIMFNGSADVNGQLYCKIGNTKVLYETLGTGSGWQAWNIDLSTVTGNLTSVRELTIGVEGGGSGVLHIDAIRLYPLIGTTITPIEPTTGLIAHYAFEGNAQDDSGMGHHGAIVGDARFAQDAIRGGVLNLNGIDAMVTVPHTAELSFGASDAYSVTAWANVSTLSGWTGVVTKSRDATPWYGIWIDGSDWTFGHDGDNLAVSAAVEGAWTHVAITYDNGQKRIYLNGLLDTESMSPMDGSGSGDLAIGGALGVSEYFEGQIDEVSLYNRALSETEVLWLTGKTQPIHKPF
jgi:hypothetical protein